MANVIKLKRGSGSDPSASDMVLGEPVLRTDTAELFFKKDNGTVAKVSGGGGSDIFINTLSSSSGSGGGSATFNGTATRFTLSNPPSVSAQQLLVSINGVIQKPNSGTSPSEGFAIDGNDIIFAAAPATGSDFFIVTYGSLNIAVPADNSVTSAKIVDGAIVNADINASAAIAGSKITPTFTSDVTISSGTPTLNFTESDANPDYRILTAGGDFVIQNDQSGSFATRFKVNPDGHVDVTGNLDVDGSITCDDIITAGALLHEGDTNTLVHFTANDEISLKTNGSTRLKVNNNGADVTGHIELSGHLDMADNGQIKLGTGDDLLIYHDGTSNIITSMNGNFFLQAAPGENGITINQNGNVKLYHDNSQKFRTYAAGVEVTGNVLIPFDGTSTTNALRMGASQDLTMYHDGSSSRIIAANHDLIVQSNGYAIRSENGSSTFATINSSGNVGIGTTSPSKTLVINENDSECVAIIKSSDTGTAGVYLGGQSDEIKGGIIFDNNTNKLTLRGHNNSIVQTIDSSGNVGIGTTSPSATVHVVNNDPQFRLQRSGSYSTTAGPLIQFQGRGPNTVNYNFAKIQAVSSGSNNAGELQIFTNSGGNQDKRMVINSSGNVGIGTTSPSRVLDVTNTGRNSVSTCFMHCDGANNVRVLGLRSDRATGSTDANMIEFFNSSGTKVGRIDSNGSSTSLIGTSDYRLKENATLITDGITRLKTLKPYRFNWKVDPTKTVDGFFAHEVTAVPEAVRGTKDQVATSDDVNDEVKEGDPIYQGLDQSKLVPLLVAALQEAIGRIEALEAG